MPTVKATSTFGNSRWSGHADVTDAQFAILADLGFLWTMQRSPSSNAEKALAGYEKRPEGFKRSSIEYSPDMANRLKSLMSAPAEIADGVSITPVIDSVVFHEIGAGAEPKYKEEKQMVQRHIEVKKDVVTWATDVVGFTGEGDLNTENVEFLKAVKAYKQRKLAEA